MKTKKQLIKEYDELIKQNISANDLVEFKKFQLRLEELAAQIFKMNKKAAKVNQF